MSRWVLLFLLLASQACVTGRPTRNLGVCPSVPTADEEAIVLADADLEAEDDADTDEETESGDIDDDADEDELPPAVELPPHPFAEMSDEALEAMLLDNPDSLGALSIGRPGAGALMGGVQMKSTERWEVVNPRETWGTPETIAYLTRAIDAVHEQFPDTPRIPVGDISDRDGGHLAPHVSHQSGRDVDIAFYYRNGAPWYTTGTANNLDLPRTWVFVRAMITQTDVSMIFIDRSIQKLLREYAQSIGEDDAWLDRVFGGPTTTLRPIIRHEKGHKSHIHVRFYNPIAQESGRRVYRALVEHKLIKPPTYYVKYKVRRGDTLNKIARKYRTSVTALKKSNRLRSNRIIAGRVYKIPRRGGVAPPPGPVVIPARRLPGTQAPAGTRVAEVDDDDDDETETETADTSATGGASTDLDSAREPRPMEGRSPAPDADATGNGATR